MARGKTVGPRGCWHHADHEALFIFRHSQVLHHHRRCKHVLSVVLPLLSRKLYQR